MMEILKLVTLLLIYDITGTAMNGSTVTCNSTNVTTPSISTVVSLATINVEGPPRAPNAVAKTIGPDMVLVVVNPSSSGGLPTSYNVTISNSSYVYTKSTPAFPNGSAMVTFTGLTNTTTYTISAVAINCAGSSNPTTTYVSFSTQSLPCHTASGNYCESSICPNTVVTYTCTIPSGTPAGNTDWTLPTGTCPKNTFPDKIRLSQYVRGDCSSQVTNMCGSSYSASSLLPLPLPSNATYCLSSKLTVKITAAINGSTVTCSNTNITDSKITTVVSFATIYVIGPPGAPNATAETIGPDMVLVVVNSSSSGGLPTSYNVTISNSSYVYTKSTLAFPNGSAIVTFYGLTNNTSIYNISAMAMNCAGSSNNTTISDIRFTGSTFTAGPDPTIIGAVVGVIIVTYCCCDHHTEENQRPPPVHWRKYTGALNNRNTQPN